MNIKLKSIATGLGKIAKRQPLEENEKKDFKWARNLIGEIYWDEEHYQEHPELSTLATNLRTDVFEIFKGISFKKIYQTLNSYEKEISLSEKELMKIKHAFEYIADRVYTPERGNI